MNEDIEAGKPQIVLFDPKEQSAPPRKFSLIAQARQGMPTDEIIRSRQRAAAAKLEC